MIRPNVWLVSGYARVFIVLHVVIASFPFGTAVFQYVLCVDILMLSMIPLFHSSLIGSAPTPLEKVRWLCSYNNSRIV